MTVFDPVFLNYLATKKLSPLVPGGNKTPALKALREEIPAMFRDAITLAGLEHDDFIVKGSCGEPNRSFAKVPWVGIFKKSITKSATKGYYIVLLFAEDMSSVSLTLNQGYTAFKDQYSNAGLAQSKLKDCASSAALIIPYLPGFISGPVDLKTDGELGLGYEAGAILSKTYSKETIASNEQIESDVSTLLAAYYSLSKKYSSSLLSLDVGISDYDYQIAAQSIKSNIPAKPSTSGPQPPPKKGYSKGREKFLRSPDVAGRSLAIANGVCALSTGNNPHHSFTSRNHKVNFLEAHHLIPFGQQEKFPYSLDVEENIVALCPNCHKLLHHAIAPEKTLPLKKLLDSREKDLISRELNITFDQLKAMYRLLNEDD